jgi:UDP-N-acetylmuramate--alanine ligase
MKANRPMKVRFKQGILGKTRHVHLVGIGGAGMSAIAEVLLNHGLIVSGSDVNAGEVTERLKARGAMVFIGHEAKNISGADVVAHSSAVKPNENSETLEARRQGVPVIKRDEMLGEVMRHKVGICVAGTHGKTTTTTMIATMLEECHLEPTALIGGVSDYFKGSSLVGTGDFMVIEADEYDRTFLKLTPTIAVITTLEAEHLDIYRDLEDVKEAFIEFANKVPFYGAIAVCNDEKNICEILPRLQRKIIRYGLGHDADLQATEISQLGAAVTFKVRYHNELLGMMNLHVAGLHNVKNALAAMAIGLEIGLSFEDIKRGLMKFQNVRRRFQMKHDGEVVVIDDYAHHPTEVRATLEAARSGWPQRRLVAVLQPHLYSRTRDFAEDFAHALDTADRSIVADIYPAREKKEDFASVTAEWITKKMTKPVMFIADKNKLVTALHQEIKSGDVVVMMGAGDITAMTEKFAQDLQNAKSNTLTLTRTH